MNNLYEMIATLQSHYNVLVIYHKSEPTNKRVFVVSSFTPIQPSFHYMDLRAREITYMLADGSFYGQFSLGRQSGLSQIEFQESQFNTKLNEIPLLHYQFSPDYTWEWYLMS